MSDYPKAWRTGEIQRAIYERAGYRCEHCGMEFLEGTTLSRWAKQKNGHPMILTVHHLDGNPANCDWTNLLACCQRCHLHIQGTWKPGGMLPWNEPPQWLIARGLAYERRPVQLPLFAGAGEK